eukprot:350467-Chlamydomonas_euryale.AAC.8
MQIISTIPPGANMPCFLQLIPHMTAQSRKKAEIGLQVWLQQVTAIGCDCLQHVAAAIWGSPAATTTRVSRCSAAHCAAAA